MMTNYEKDLITRPWKAFIGFKPHYFTYMELMKAINTGSISLDTMVTRREKDHIGVRLGEVNVFTPSYYLGLKPKVTPSHTPDAEVRSYFRIEKTKEVFLKFNDKTRQCFLLFSFGAGGVGFKSTEKLENIYLKQKNVILSIPGFTIDGDKSFSTTGRFLSAKKNKSDYTYFFVFDGLDERKKVLINRNCFFLKDLNIDGSYSSTSLAC